jgi:[ribosomal protein S5]-alanine N-acetyltransferase
MASIEHITFPSLATDRLRLRSLTLADTDFVFRHFSDPAVAEHLLDEPPLTDVAQAEAIIRFYLEPEGNTCNRWGIALKDGGQLIGTCGFHKWDKAHRRAEVGYDLSPAYWRQGYMAEALRAVLQHGFDRLGLHRIDALVYVDNARSVGLLQKLGFQIEGTLRDYFCQDGVFYDHFVLSLINSSSTANQPVPDPPCC